MRIISGKYKNKTLRSPNSDNTHPMGERERLAISNMLGDIVGKTVLDLFAGTGALGIEALSRGASSATFVENNPKTLVVLKDNLKGVEDARIIKCDAYKYQPDKRFDVVFVDPPYDKFNIDVIEFKKFLKEDGELVVSSSEPISETSRKYANCYITIISSK